MRYPCWLLGHSIAWEYDAGEKSCHQRGFCENQGCTRTSEHVLHDFGPWGSPDSKSCEVRRSCARCGHPEYTIEHDYEWRYYIEGACEQERVCIRCDIVDNTVGVRTKHAWKGWEFSKDENFVINVCPRCSLSDKKAATKSNL